MHFCVFQKSSEAYNLGAMQLTYVTINFKPFGYASAVYDSSIKGTIETITVIPAYIGGIPMRSLMYHIVWQIIRSTK